MEEKKLRLSRFCQQSESYRTKYTWIHGSLLASKKEVRHSFYLYEVDGFFVELVYNQKSEKIVSINPLMKNKHLMKYVENINLSETLLQ